MLLSNLQNAFQSLSYVKHTMCLWGSSSGYFIVRKITFRETKPLSWSWGSHHCLPVPHPGPFAPHSAVPAEAGHPTRGAVGLCWYSWASPLRSPGATETQGACLHLNLAPTFNGSTLFFISLSPTPSTGRGRALWCCYKGLLFNSSHFSKVKWLAPIRDLPSLGYACRRRGLRGANEQRIEGHPESVSKETSIGLQTDYAFDLIFILL